MWKRKLHKEENWQEFIKTEGDIAEVLRAPIRIDDGRYEIFDILSNSGGFGVIYKAKDTVLFGRTVLIKAKRYTKEGLFIYENHSKRESTIQEKRKDTLFEAKTLCIFKRNKESRMPNVNNIVKDFSPELRGPHVDMDGCTFYYENEEMYNSEPYIVMQEIDGQNLLEYSESERNNFSIPMWEIKVLEIAKELVTILASINKLRKKEDKMHYYIYKDLKPENVMITEGKYLTLLDFGGVGMVYQKANGEFISNEEGCGAGNVYTIGYCSPEASSNSGMEKMLDQRVDVYSLGMTMFQLLVGGHIMTLIDPNTHLPILNKLDGKCSPVTRNLIEKCIKYDREERFNNMKEISTYIMKEAFTKAKIYWKEQEQVQA